MHPRRRAAAQPKDSASEMKKALQKTRDISYDIEETDSGYDESLDDMDDFTVGENYADDYEAKPKKPKKPNTDKTQDTLTDFIQKANVKTQKKSAASKKDKSFDADLEMAALMESIVTSKSSKEKKKKTKKLTKSFDDDLDFDQEEEPQAPLEQREKRSTLSTSEPVQITKAPVSKTVEKESLHKDPQDSEPAKPEFQRQKREIENIILDIEDTPEVEFVKDKEVIESVISTRPIRLDGVSQLEMFLFNVHDEGGSLFLFGKVRNNNSYQTMCVVVESPTYPLQFLPSGPKGETEADLEEEIQKIAHRAGAKVISIEYKKKQYSFEDQTIPKSTEWACVELSSSADLRQVPLTGDYYTHVFGLTSSLSEVFLVNQKIYGPTWVTVTNFKVVHDGYSLCQMLSVAESSQVNVIKNRTDIPAFNICSFSMKSIYNEKKKAHEIFMLTSGVFPGWDIEKWQPISEQADKLKNTVTFVCAPSMASLSTEFRNDKNLPQSIIICKSEEDLLSRFLDRLNEYDIDFLASYSVCDVDIPLIVERMNACKVTRQYRLGRIKRTGRLSPKSSNFIAGRLPVDIRVSSIEFLYAKANDFSSIVEKELNQSRQSIEHFNLVNEITDKRRLMNLINYNKKDVIYTNQLMNKIKTLPLTMEISRLSACPWGRVLMGQSSHRCESLLVHRFSELNFIIPDKVKYQGKPKKEEKYKGGKVLDPKKGLHEHCIIVLDFNSLYPSVIREYNICFTTVDRENPDALESQKAKNAGVLPTLMENLLTSRKKIKQMLAQEEAKPNPDSLTIRRLNINQLAVKLLANSMYGYLGYSGSRFKAQELAALVTQMGRQALEHAVFSVENKGYSIVYGDTDSVMIDSNTTVIQEAIDKASELRSIINKNFKKIEMGFDGLFTKILLISKKKYAALVYDFITKTTKQQIKGLDMVRRDWCDLMKTIAKFVLNQFLSDLDRDKARANIQNELERVAKILWNNGVPPADLPEPEYEGAIQSITKEDLIIRKALTKPIESYPQNKSHAHVCVARTMISKGEHVQLNQTISYIICLSESKDLGDKAKHPGEVAELADADIKWYLFNQILNPIWRLCEPFGDIQKSMLSAALGLTSPSESLYRDAEIENEAVFIPHLTDLFYECMNVDCQCQIKIGVISPSLFTCPKCNYTHNWKRVANALTQKIQQFIQHKTQKLCKCGGHLCDYSSQQLPASTLNPYHQNSYANGKACSNDLVLKIPVVDFFNTLRYFDNLFKLTEKSSEDEDSELFRAYMEKYCQKIIDNHAYQHIRVSSLFS